MDIIYSVILGTYYCQWFSQLKSMLSLSRTHCTLSRTHAHTHTHTISLWTRVRHLKPNLGWGTMLLISSRHSSNTSVELAYIHAIRRINEIKIHDRVLTYMYELWGVKPEIRLWIILLGIKMYDINPNQPFLRQFMALWCMTQFWSPFWCHCVK